MAHNLAALEPLAEQHVRLNTQIKALERVLDQVNDRIHAELGDSDEKIELTVGRYKIDRQQITSSRVDGKALKERYPDVHEECSKESSYRRLAIREVAKPDAAVLTELAEFAAKLDHTPQPAPAAAEPAVEVIAPANLTDREAAALAAELGAQTPSRRRRRQA